jgi:hypothetical protein
MRNVKWEAGGTAVFIFLFIFIFIFQTARSDAQTVSREPAFLSDGSPPSRQRVRLLVLP